MSPRMTRTHVSRPDDGDAGDRAMVIDALVHDRPAIALAGPLIAVARAGAARVLGGLVVHDFRAVLRELRPSLPSVARGTVWATGDAPRIGGEHAADVGIDVDPKTHRARRRAQPP